MAFELKVKKPLRKYEAVIIMHPDATDADQKALFKKNQGIIKTFEGDVNHVDTWGKRRLANAIKKMKVGTYFHTMFSANAECVAELERTMRINEKVLRFMHTRLNDKKTVTEHLDQYRQTLAATAKREQERDAKNQMRKAGMGGGGFSDKRKERQF